MKKEIKERLQEIVHLIKVSQGEIRESWINHLVGYIEGITYEE